VALFSYLISESPSHYGDVASDYRKTMEAEKKNGCKCGEKRPYVLLVHHIDGNDQNNVKENLEIVCANCHMIRHLKLVDGVWCYCTLSLTPRDKIEELTRAGMC
jgi:hypothetical protein